MEILYEYQCGGLSLAGLIFVCVICGLILGAMITVSCDNGFNLKVFVLTSIAIAGIMFSILFSVGVTKEEIRYKGYITNLEEYYENYDTIDVKGKLITAKLKEKK